MPELFGKPPKYCATVRPLCPTKANKGTSELSYSSTIFAYGKIIYVIQRSYYMRFTGTIWECCLQSRNIAYFISLKVGKSSGREVRMLYIPIVTRILMHANSSPVSPALKFNILPNDRSTQTPTIT